MRHDLCATIYAPLSMQSACLMGHSLEIQTSPSGQHVLLLGNNQGLLDAEQAPGAKLAASHFPFLRSIPQRQGCIPRKRQAVLRKAESLISLQLGGHHTVTLVLSKCVCLAYFSFSKDAYPVHNINSQNIFKPYYRFVYA